MKNTNSPEVKKRKRQIALANLQQHAVKYKANIMPSGKPCSPEHAAKQLERITNEVKTLQERIM